MGNKSAARAAIRDFLLTRRARITPAAHNVRDHRSELLASWSEAGVVTRTVTDSLAGDQASDQEPPSQH
jgi:hypothetical protein